MRPMSSVLRRGAGSLLLLLLSLAPQAGANEASPVDVVGLFKNRAVLRLPNLPEFMLRTGQEKHGVTLLAADANQARIRYQDQTYRLNLSSRIRGGYRKVEQAQVTINADPMGQFYIRGAVNERFVNFLVDTGASVVAISSQAATSLGLEYRSGQPGRVQTAQGVVDSYFIKLPKVTVGSITVPNVDAAIIEGSFPTEILLGMSFLRNVRMQESDGVLMLTQKF